MIAINKKSGEHYIILQEDIVNATNKNNSERMVLYVKESEAGLDDPQLYVRETTEFYDKFDIK